MSSSEPTVNAMLFCDQAFQQAQTGKWCIIGIYSMVWVREFPTAHSPLSVFVSLSDFKGETNIQVVVRDTQGAKLLGVGGQVPTIPHGIFELAFPMPPIALKEAGTYTVEFLAGDRLLAMRSLKVELAPPMPNQGGGPAPTGGSRGPRGSLPGTEPN